ncbi:hypothetical protein A2841_00835 [Candidatus Kaiserbacteria bacterium RIFCSPHIGHO2_01_FULL_48_10]|uniref:Uncharacterized protein n=1 Tax=Candidatus Kaiserbacteria bacterium RIFCSPHIGHO2_01_FULL_48_10 TaxID=1798476 RepID=A0A1F6C6E0_9BACT|nr:MAG: hypothetical protein A2841_00835 [Candidatus Kaiserbacteria bacterium RIFCSPHIGHO2_01_FULL_48_10]
MIIERPTKGDIAVMNYLLARARVAYLKARAIEGLPLLRPVLEPTVAAEIDVIDRERDAFYAEIKADPTWIGNKNKKI